MDFDSVSSNVREYDTNGVVIEDQSFSFENMKAYQTMYVTQSLDDSTAKIEITSYDILEKTSQAFNYNA